MSYTSEPEFHGLPIMTDKEKDQRCDTDILGEIKRQFDHTENWPKVFCMRYDVRFPAGIPSHSDNETIRNFQATFIKTLKRIGGHSPRYVLVREQSREKHQHYHGLLLLDGQKTNSIHTPINTAERLWDKTMGLKYEVQPENKRPGHGLIDDCTKDRQGNRHPNGIMLRHDDPDRASKLKSAFYQASYLAKENQKGHNPKGTRQVFSSRIPKE